MTMERCVICGRLEEQTIQQQYVSNFNYQNSIIFSNLDVPNMGFFCKKHRKIAGIWADMAEKYAAEYEKAVMVEVRELLKEQNQLLQQVVQLLSAKSKKKKQPPDSSISLKIIRRLKQKTARTANQKPKKK